MMFPAQIVPISANQVSIHTGHLLAGLCSILLIINMAGCGDDDITGPGNGNGPGNGAQVAMEGHSFVPSAIEVEVGTTVVWVNNSSETHTVTSGSNGEHDGQFDSGNIPPDGEYSYEFTEAGTYDYYCIPHLQSGMTGTVTVVENGGGSGSGGNGGGNGY